MPVASVATGALMLEAFTVAVRVTVALTSLLAMVRVPVWEPVVLELNVT